MTNKTIEAIKKTREYLDYVEEHVKNVQKAWTELQDKCKSEPFVYDDYNYLIIETAVKAHDLSKLSEQEFIQYRKSFYPTDYEREEKDDKYDMTEAWDHHKAKNLHHWEHWVLIPDVSVIPCVLMLIDWMAMGYKFGGTAQSYYEKNTKKILLPKGHVKFLYRVFKLLR